MGFNADASRHSLPRGRVFFARKSTAGVLGPMVHLGNCSKLDFSTIGDDITEVVDFTSNTATPLTRISKKRVPEFPLSLYECNPDNLALVFMAADPSEFTQTSTPITGEALDGGVKVGAIYKTKKFGPISSVAVKKGVTVLTAGTNYIVRDANVGLIEILSLPGGVSAGDAITVDYTPTAYSAGSGFKQVLGGGVSRIEGSLMYSGASNVGPRHLLQIYNCAITSDGNFPFVAADVAEFGLKVNVLTDGVHSELFLLTELSNGSGAPLA